MKYWMCVQNVYVRTDSFEDFIIAARLGCQARRKMR